MSTIALRCNECGSPLKVPASTRFVTCSHCDASLQIKHEGGAAFTEVAESIGRIEKNTRQVRDDMQVIKLQNELERIDREWSMRQESFKIRGKHGHATLPTKNTAMGARIGSVVAVLFGVFWIVQAVQMGAPMFFPLFGVFFIGFAIFVTTKASQKANEYERARARYDAERRAVQDQLDRLQR